MGRGDDSGRRAGINGEPDAVALLIAADRSGRNGDDAAVVQTPERCICISTDAAVAGRHLDASLTPWQMGYRAAACALSDLAAMASTARAVVSAISVPEGRWDDVMELSAGIDARAAECGAELVGGDLVGVGADDPLTIALTCVGSPPAAADFTLREGARPGDLIAVTGVLGAGWTGLQALREDDVASSGTNRYVMPPHRLAAGQALGPIVHAMADVSDGIASDVRHIATASRCGTRIDLARLPVAPGLSAGQRELAATWGDDYELLVVLAPERLAEARIALAQVSPHLGLTIIGECTDAESVWVDGERPVQQLYGFRHGIR